MSTGNRGILKVFRRAAKKAKNFRLFTKRSSFEGFFASKGAAYALPDGDFARRATKHGGEMQLHLQAMVNLLRDEDVLRLVVKLESQYPNRIRYLTIVSAFGPDEEEQSIVMGVDWTERATIGLVVPLYRDTVIKLDGDGGFKMTSAGTAIIFKPISVQTMWTALQWIHKCTDIARRNNYFFPNGSSHAWVEYYYRKISSDRICLNEWHQMEDLLSKRPESPIGTSPEKELIMKLIRHKLREVMMKVDLEEVTSRQVRTMLEEDTQMNLREYRSFIDEEMFTILGQMDSASKIFDHVYLGSEWNASNLEELKDNGVGYILNITREIDNFFPGTFCYHNIRVYDLDETELLHHWDNTYKFIQRAKNAGSKVLVHCRMGISRSASTVIAYGMKEYGWSLGDTMKYVKARRSIVQPNAGFWKQLITYEGILNSSKQRYNKLFTTKASDMGAARKKKKPGNTANETSEQTARPLIHDSPIKTESVIMYQHPSEETTQVTTEGTDDTLLASEALFKNRDGDPVMIASSPVNSTTDSSQDLVGETAGSRDLEIAGIDKTTLYRVSSVPNLPSGDKMRQKSNAEINGNFQRSSSLRERGRRNVENLNAYKAASDEHITEFGQKQQETAVSSTENFFIKEPDVELQQSKLIEKCSVENPSCDGTEMEHQDRGGVPGELHGVLESGFVKRYSRNFEEGVCNVPSVLPVLEGSTNLEEEVVVVCAADESFERSTELIASTPSEEPGPGVVKKHKEEYELKHRQSLKRGAVLQRSGSGDRGSLKRERGEILGNDSDSKAEEGWEDDRESAVNVDALVQKVNEDMKKEVSVRRILKKGVELRASVQQAGEQMEDAATDDHQRNLKQALNNSVIDKGYHGSTGESFSEKVKELLLEEPQPTEKSAESKEMSSSAVRNEGSDVSAVPHSSTEHDLSAELFRSSDDREDTISEQDKESIPQKGLVKHRTLLIEGRLQPLSDRHAEGEDEIEGEPTVSRDGDAGLPSEEEARGLAVETLPASVADDVNAIQEAEAMEQQTRDVACEKKERTSDQDDGNAPQKGLVKRHTLVIEGKIQPMEQVLVQNVENEAGEENTKSDQEKSTQPLKEETRGTCCDSAERLASVAIDAVAEGESSEKDVATEQKEACELLDDREDKASERDIENVLQKGLVKRHTLLIEGRLQPVCQEYENEANRKDDPVVGTDNLSALDSEEVAPDVVPDVSVKDKSPSGETEDRTSKASDQDTELPAEKGLVKRHTLLIEARKLQPLEQGEEGEDEKLIEEGVCQDSWDSVDEQQQYQIERSNKTTPEETEGENADSEMVSGLVKRETMRIEERVKPAVVETSTPKPAEIEMLTCNSGTVLEGGRGGGESCREAEKNDDERGGGEASEQFMEQEKAEVGVDTSSVVRVKDHTQHLEGIIRITTTAKDGENSKSQISKDEDFPVSRDEPPKIVLIPRWYSDDRSDQKVELSSSEKLLADRMEEILTESAVNVALLKAQENLNLENERFVDWDFANVKQRTRIFEEIVADVDSNRREDDRGSDSPIRRCESLPKAIRPSQKYVLRRRSFSDVSETVSSSSGRKVDYTIHFSNGECSSSSSLPREWSPLQERQTRETRDERKTDKDFSPEIKGKID